MAAAFVAALVLVRRFGFDFLPGMIQMDSQAPSLSCVSRCGGPCGGPLLRVSCDALSICTSRIAYVCTDFADLNAASLALV